MALPPVATVGGPDAELFPCGCIAAVRIYEVDLF
jgi:hypothetical protein